MHRGEVWLVDLDPGKGSEQAKTRPAVIVSVDGIGRLPLRVVVPITGWDDRYYTYPWMVQIAHDGRNGLTKLSAADCLNIRAVDTRRFIERRGDVRKETMEDLLAALSIVLGIDT